MFLYYVEFLELGRGICEASASSMLRKGDWDHIRDMVQKLEIYLERSNFNEIRRSAVCDTIHTI